MLVAQSRSLIISASDDETVGVWDRRVPRYKVGAFTGHTNGVNHIAIKGDGRHFLSSSKDDTIAVWDLRAMLPPHAYTAQCAKRKGTY